jgi:cardiolipin synthase
MKVLTIRPPYLSSIGKLSVLLPCLCLAACVSSGPRDQASLAAAEWEKDARPPAEPRHLVRRMAGFAQALVLGIRSSSLDPLLRPVSTGSAYSAVVAKSASGFARRLALDTLQFRRLEREPVPPLADRPFMDKAQWETHLDRSVGGVKSVGTVDFLVDGGEFFSRFNRAIDEAQSSIDIRTYIFDSDDYGVHMADRLKARSEDVDVRVLLDGLGELFATQSDPDSMPAHFRPPASMPRYLRRDSKVRVRTRTNPLLSGDHTKTVVLDRKIAFIGGMNIGREYRYDWHDMMMEVEGPVVGVMQKEFDRTWAHAGPLGDLARLFGALFKRDVSTEGEGVELRLLFTRDFDSQIYRAQLEAIRNAQRRIYMQNAYFSDDLLIYELAKARRRGVDVRVIITERADDATMNLSNEATISVLLRNGVRVYHYPGMSHVKAAVYDGWACVGSGNFDKMSLQVNEEMNLGISDPATVRALVERVFEADFERSVELSEAPRLTLVHRLAEMVADELL